MKFEAKVEVSDGKFAYLPTPDGRTLGSAHLEAIKCRWSPPNWQYHLAQRGGHVACLKYHLASTVFCVIDISQFFPSIGVSKIERSLKRVGFSFSDARAISLQSTVKDGGRTFLPYGFLQSPMLASLVMDKSAIGNAVRQLIKEGCKISTYVDDIIISHHSDELLVKGAFERLSSAIEEAKFIINTAKSQSPSEAIGVFNLHLEHNNIFVQEARMRDFRWRLRSNPPWRVQEGIINYVWSVNTDQAEALVKSM